MSNNTPQPPPTINDSIPVYELVIADLRERAIFGLQKYKTYLQAHNGRDALIDAYQEAIDLTNYLRQLIEERKQSPANERLKHWNEGWKDALDFVRYTLRHYPHQGGDSEIMSEVNRLIRIAMDGGRPGHCEHEWQPYNKRYARCQKCKQFDPAIGSEGPLSKEGTR